MAETLHRFNPNKTPNPEARSPIQPEQFPNRPGAARTQPAKNPESEDPGRCNPEQFNRVYANSSSSAQSRA